MQHLRLLYPNRAESTALVRDTAWSPTEPLSPAADADAPDQQEQGKTPFLFSLLKMSTLGLYSDQVGKESGHCSIYS